MAANSTPINICVYGLWHLGTVTAACLADAGHQVVGLDFDQDNIARLQQGTAPVMEPGLDRLLASGLQSGRLAFTANPQAALQQAAVVWVTYDTPVDENDQADTDYVLDRVTALFKWLAGETLILISSQLPVGSTARLEARLRESGSDQPVSFAYSPENLRLGKAIQVFTQPDRVVVGVRRDADRQMITALLQPITDKIEWMSVESAEMTKHALNAFLALSVAFMNEVAVLCERVGADANEVERGLKSEARIGPYAYLRPGGAFAGGTLARDVTFLKNLGERHHTTTYLFDAILTSNNDHKRWAYHRLKALLGDLRGKTVTLLGLTYKPGTSTLRRSLAVELCRLLLAEGANVQAFDPQAEPLPPDLRDQVSVRPSAAAALSGADAAIVTTEWPEFRSLPRSAFTDGMAAPLILDPNRFLGAVFQPDEENQPVQYYAVGKP